MFGISKKLLLLIALVGYVVPTLSLPALADPMSVFRAVPSSVAPDIGVLERRYFGHTYDKDATDKRIQRLELLLFGATQDGGMVERLDRLSQFSAERAERAKMPKSANHQASENASIGALEKKILKKTFDAEPAAQRLSRLESKVFGAPTPSMSVADRVFRLKKILNVDTPSISRVPPSFQRPGETELITPFGGSFNVVPFGPGSGDDLATQMNEMMRQMNKSLRGLHRLPDGAPSASPFLSPNVSPFAGPNSPLIEPYIPRANPVKKPETELPPYLDPNSI